ncbi:MAG TPA: sulfatase-like hydrolase/transferase [Thermoleophilaceae bacterium]|jgi:hypothetical protein
MVALAALVGATPAAAAAKGPARPPVVLLTLDEFPLDSLLGPDGRIDAERYPNFAALAATSSWFPDATTVYDETIRAVPAILDARLPRPEALNTLADHPQNAFTLFGGAGYRVVASEEATAMCPRRYCPGAPETSAMRHYLAGGRVHRFDRWLREIEPGPPAFYYKHLFLPHGPRRYLPSGKEIAPSRPGPLSGLTGPAGFFDRGLTNENHARYLLQLGFTDRLLGRLIRRLRSRGMFDRALVVVTADHGFAFDVGVPDRRSVTRRNIDEIAPVPLFIKGPGQRRAHVGMQYARTVDVLPTIAGIAGLRIPWHHAGRPVWDPSVRSRRGVRIVARDFSHSVTIGARHLLERRRANILRAWHLFGTGAESRRLYGSPYGALYRVGPHPSLIDRKVSSVRGGTPSRAHVRLPDAHRWRAVDTRSPVLPVKVAGVITQPGHRTERDLAVAVNGRVRAVGRSVRLRGGHDELFSVLVPEHALRQGRNSVRVYEVTGRGSRLALHPMKGDG